VVASDTRESVKHLVEERACMDLQQKITEALEEHLVVTQQLTAMSPLILQVASEVVATLRRQGKVVLCGNGGSASDAQHIAAEMQGIRGPCTCTLRLNTPGSPTDCHRGKKA
jgi:NAD(P)H-hydrate repair Nnr-like enzyme with NAD(P)H-hydrate epimerase domain